MNQTKLFFLLIAALAFASCGSDEPRYANPEAHEKTVQLNEQYFHQPHPWTRTVIDSLL